MTGCAGIADGLPSVALAKEGRSGRIATAPEVFRASESRAGPPVLQYYTNLVYFMIASPQTCLVPPIPTILRPSADSAGATTMPVLRVLRLLAGNQSKLLSINHLHAALGFPGQPQSRLIKVNQAMFLSHNPHVPWRQRIGLPSRCFGSEGLAKAGSC